MTALQYLSLVMWGGMALYLTRPAIRAFTPSAKSLDMLWAAVWPLMVNRCAFIITSGLLGRAQWALISCYILSLIAGCTFAAAVISYRRSDA